MQHEIPVQQLGPQAGHMAEAVQTCVHCGFCLPVCPTYQIMGEEMDSPRGRIFLMKEVLEGKVDAAEAATYIDRCLGCEGCVTACPSGVKYGELITPFRAHTEEHRKRSLMDRLLRWFILSTLPHPKRFRWALRMGKVGKLFRFMMPRRMKGMLDLLPANQPRAAKLPEVTEAQGERKARVALLAGCAQEVLSPSINRATVNVLAANGVEVVIPKAQKCCGALAAHTGALDQAKSFARHNLTAFPDDVDAILTNAAGCGSGIKEYGLWLSGESEEAQAQAFSQRVMDVSVFLDQLELQPMRLPEKTRVAYHDACHLAHAQGVTSPPRRLLEQIDNLELVEIPGGEMCCGSAGTYNLEQPNAAAELGQQKAEAVRSTNADLVAMGNIGCMTQIDVHLKRLDAETPVMHTMELLERALS